FLLKAMKPRNRTCSRFRLRPETAEVHGIVQRRFLYSRCDRIAHALLLCTVVGRGWIRRDHQKPRASPAQRLRHRRFVGDIADKRLGPFLHILLQFAGIPANHTYLFAFLQQNPGDHRPDISCCTEYCVHRLLLDGPSRPTTSAPSCPPSWQNRLPQCSRRRRGELRPFRDRSSIHVRCVWPSLWCPRRRYLDRRAASPLPPPPRRYESKPTTRRSPCSQARSA